MGKLAFLVLALLVVFPSSYGQMKVNEDTFLAICQQSANKSWRVSCGRLLDKPYNPGTFAWELSYSQRAFVDLYNLTGDMIWVERAIAWADHLLNYSDVNHDREPAWGNYNETWGTDRYDFVEFTVHDGVISVPLLELVQLIYGREELSSNATLKAKADTYLGLVKAVVDRHHSYWTDVTEDCGYYWNDPGSDELVIVNRFAALGNAELILYDILKDPVYLDKPERMARLIKDDLEYKEGDDCYIWSYAVGGSGAEDVSHGSIDLEFMFKCYQHSLVFDRTDMQRLVNTYQRRIWQGIDMFRTGVALSYAVDGSLNPSTDNTRTARTWPILCLFEPRILEQHRVAWEVYSRKGLPFDRVMAATFGLMARMEVALREMGIDLDSLDAFFPEEVLVEIDGLNQTVASAEEVGGNVGDLRNLTDCLYRTYIEDMDEGISGLLERIWQATELAERARAQSYLSAAEEVIAAAKEAGIDTSRHELFLERARLSMDQGLYSSVVSMCQYPLSLREELGESRVISLLSLVLLAVTFAWLGTRTGRESEISVSPRRRYDNRLESGI